MKYSVKIIETLEKTVEVEADNPIDAEQIAEDEWHNAEQYRYPEKFFEVNGKIRGHKIKPKEIER